MITFKIKMAIETERKFLVSGNFKMKATKQKNIIQKYLVIDPDKTVRVRISDDKAFLTIKSRLTTGSISRSEWEVAIPVEDARGMMKICLPGKIEKTRYLVPSGKHTFEVDVFHDKNEGLIIAEVELGSESEEFEKPEWLGREVTGDPAYYNANLLK
jgi:adenylate cyclase